MRFTPAPISTRHTQSVMELDATSPRPPGCCSDERRASGLARRARRHARWEVDKSGCGVPELGRAPGVALRDTSIALSRAARCGFKRRSLRRRRCGLRPTAGLMLCTALSPDRRPDGRPCPSRARSSHGGDPEGARLDTAVEGEDSRGLEWGVPRSERPRRRPGRKPALMIPSAAGWRPLRTTPQRSRAARRSLRQNPCTRGAQR